MFRLIDVQLSGKGLLWLAFAAAIPSLLVLAVFGVISKHDSLGYIEYASEIRTHTVPTGMALLTQSPAPISIFRIGGFPAFLALLQAVFPNLWAFILVALQIIAETGIALLTYRTAINLGATPRLSFIAALLPTFGFIIVVNICVLTDALYSAAITAAAFTLILKRSWRGALIAGFLIALATSFREVTIFLVFGFIPLACLPKRKLLCTVLVVLPTWGIAAMQIGWNMSRGAGPTLTTSAQITMVQAVLPLLKNKVPVYDSNTTFDHVATQTVGVDGYNRIDDMQTQLFAAGLTAPKIAKIAGQEYFRTWRRYPLKMLATSLSNYNGGFLAMPFEPLDVAAFLIEYDDLPRPYFTRLNILWQGLTQGHITAFLWLIINILSRICGSIISIYALICPWLRQPNRPTRWAERALWCLPIALAGLYMPVHLEYRYLLPGVPIICVLAAVGWSHRNVISKQEITT